NRSVSIDRARGLGSRCTLLIWAIRRPPSECALVRDSGAKHGRVPRNSHPHLGSIPKSRTQSRFPSGLLLVVVLCQYAVFPVPGHQWPLMLLGGRDRAFLPLMD